MIAYIATLSREQFLAWLGGQYTPSATKLQSPDTQRRLSDDGLLLLWNVRPDHEGPDGPPQPVVAVPERGMREFFAFVGTYVSTYQPFSAFIRVISREVLKDLLADEERAAKRQLPNLLVGAVIAEAKLQMGERARRPADLPVQACLGTLSSTAVASLRAGLDRQRLDEVMGRWLRTRSRLTESSLRADPVRVRDFWDMVALVYQDDPERAKADNQADHEIASFIAEVTASGDEADPKSWAILTKRLPAAYDALARMRDTREDRVRAMDDAMAGTMLVDEVNLRQREMVLGYLASRVAGGSLGYLHLLQPVETALPMAQLWFGLFSSLRTDTDVMIAGECLGRRVARRLNRRADLFDPPEADVSFDELETLAPDGRAEIKIRTEHQGAITVEIAPTIAATFRLARDSRREEGSRDATTTSPQTAQEMRYLINRMSRVVDGLIGPTSRQGSLIDDREPSDRSRSYKSKRTTR